MKRILFSVGISVILVSCNTDITNRETTAATSALSRSIPELKVGTWNDNDFYLIDAEVMLKAFNNISEIPAAEVNIYSYDKDELELFFIVEEGYGLSLPLKKKADDVFYLQGVHDTGTEHTCSGDPCSSCKFKRGWSLVGPGPIEGCECAQTEVDGVKQKCNHSIKDNWGFEDADLESEFGARLILEYNSLQ